MEVINERDERRSTVVLIIDDEWDSRTILRHQLESIGYLVVSAASGPAGIRLARQKSPDLIILDLSMPEMTGWQVLEKLRANPRLGEIPVVIVSATAKESHSSRFSDVVRLPKPIDEEALKAVVKQAIRPAIQAVE